MVSSTVVATSARANVFWNPWADPTSPEWNEPDADYPMSDDVPPFVSVTYIYDGEREAHDLESNLEVEYDPDSGNKMQIIVNVRDYGIGVAHTGAVIIRFQASADAREQDIEVRESSETFGDKSHFKGEYSWEVELGTYKFAAIAWDLYDQRTDSPWTTLKVAEKEEEKDTTPIIPTEDGEWEYQGTHPDGDWVKGLASTNERSRAEYIAQKALARDYHWDDYLKLWYDLRGTPDKQSARSRFLTQPPHWHVRETYWYNTWDNREYPDDWQRNELKYLKWHYWDPVDSVYKGYKRFFTVYDWEFATGDPQGSLVQGRILQERWWIDSDTEDTDDDLPPGQARG